jgi:hypothetical protein
MYEDFPWESEEQRKGYLALIQYRRKLGKNPEIVVDPTAAFFIQKDHESHEWMIEMLGRVIGELRTEILTLRTALERAGINPS